MCYVVCTRSGSATNLFSPIFIDGAFLCLKFSRDAMSELSNEKIFNDWQECNRTNRPQGAEYWYGFMSKRAKRGYKGAQAVIDKMDRLK